MNIRLSLFVLLSLAFIAGCTEPRIHPTVPAVRAPASSAATSPAPATGNSAEIPADAQAARLALLTMASDAGNRWMAADLAKEPIIREGDHYCVGRWQFSLEKMTFSFEHTNRNVSPPILVKFTGTLERTASGKFTANVVRTRKLPNVHAVASTPCAQMSRPINGPAQTSNSNPLRTGF